MGYQQGTSFWDFIAFRCIMMEGKQQAEKQKKCSAIVDCCMFVVVVVSN